MGIKRRLKEQGQHKMDLSRKHVLFQFLLVSLFLFFLSLSLIFPLSKQLEVKNEKADIHLAPDINSPVIETLERGEIVTLASTRTFKRLWSYVYFTSRETRASKSGYILNSAVSKLFRVTKVNTISDPKEAKRTTDSSVSPMKNVAWGISSEQLLELEGDPQSSEQKDGWSVFEYHRRVIGLLCQFQYHFSGNRLVKTEFVFPGRYTRKTGHIENYKKIKAALIQDYGEPLEENTLWRNPMHQGDPSSWGEAVSLGHLEYESRWLTPDTGVSLNLSGLDEQIVLKLSYTRLSLQ